MSSALRIATRSSPTTIAVSITGWTKACRFSPRRCPADIYAPAPMASRSPQSQTCIMGELDRANFPISTLAADKSRPHAFGVPNLFHLGACLGLIHAKHIPAISIKEGRDPVVGDAVHMHRDFL